MRKVRGYQMGNQKPKVVEGQTIQWSNEKGQMDKLWLNLR